MSTPEPRAKMESSHLTVRYGEKVAIKDISLAIPERRVDEDQAICFRQTRQLVAADRQLLRGAAERRPLFSDCQKLSVAAPPLWPKSTTLRMPGCFRKYSTPCLTSSAMTSQMTDASLLSKREFIASTRKPRLESSRAARCPR